MDLINAVDRRISRRTYSSRPVSAETLEKLRKCADECNRTGGLGIRMMDDGQGAFSFAKSRGFLSNIKYYFILAGPSEDEYCAEKLGYFGEMLVLKAVSMGLGTCWIAGTYDREAVKAKVGENEIMRCCIVFGNVGSSLSAKEMMISKGLKRNSKQIKDMLYTEEQPPNWAVSGVRLAARAPSAKNRQGVTFIYSSDTVIARSEMRFETDPYDLGIAKLHFEIGAGFGKGHWNFGNGGIYERVR